MEEWNEPLLTKSAIRTLAELRISNNFSTKIETLRRKIFVGKAMKAEFTQKSDYGHFSIST